MLSLVLRISLTIPFLLATIAEAQTPARPARSPAEAPAPPSPSPSPAKVGLDALNAADLQAAISLVQQRYVNPAAVSGAELNRATLDGLLRRLDGGVVLLPARPAATPTPAPFYREIIDGHIGYLRLGDLSRGQLQELDTTLRGFAGKKVDALVLDLRGSVEADDYGVAAEFANRFVAKDKPLFSLRGTAGAPNRDFVSTQNPAYIGFLAVLVDGGTAGATETLAGVLRQNDKAILIGQATAGRAVVYTDSPLPGGSILRIAVAQAILPEQAPRFGEGIEPDLTVALSTQEKDAIFQESLSKGMAPFVFEADRPHLNEAALLAGTNPEIDASQQRRARAGDKSAQHDAVLQRAVDLVTSIEVYERQPGRSP